MPFLELLVLAITAMAMLALSRVIRVHLGRAPHPEGIARYLFVLAFLFGPPIALGALTQPAGAASGQVSGVASAPIYGVMLAGLGFLMGVVASVVRLVPPGPSRALVLLALVGSQGDPEEVSSNPALSARLTTSVAQVDRTNAVFPRGLEFPAQVDRVGFRARWNALDGATATLERQIAEDQRLGVAVAIAATAAAKDARSRLDTLHRLAVNQGQA